MINQELIDVATVIANRDEIDLDEAIQVIRETMAEIRAAIEEGDFCEAEELWTSNTGLEPDYLEKLL